MFDLYMLFDYYDICEWVVLYLSVIDLCDFDVFDMVFMFDVVIDYCMMGGIVGCYLDVKVWLCIVLLWFLWYQYLVGNLLIWFDGDIVCGCMICFNLMEVVLLDGGMQVMFFGLWYVDWFVCIVYGLCIVECVEVCCYGYNVLVVFVGMIG